MNVTLLVITDGRADCLRQTLAAFDMFVDQSLIGTRVLVDDSADPAYGQWIDEAYSFDLHLQATHRRGFAGAIAAGWRAVANAEYVFHLEDDFVMARHIPVGDMVEVLIENPQLAQMALRRQPWNSEEKAAGGYVACHPDAYTDVYDLTNDRAWLEHRMFFTTNPSVYPHRIVDRGWPLMNQSEGIFSLDLFRAEPDTVCGIWGRRDDDPWVIHIGDQRIGQGY